MHLLGKENEGAAKGAALLRLRGARKRFGSIQALDDVDFEVGEGEIRGLCGHNGAGKSTLVKVLTGLHSLDEGELIFGGAPLRPAGPRDAQAAGIAIVDQELSVVPTLSVLENLFIGDIRSSFLVRPRKQRARARELLSRVGLGHLPLTAPAEELAIGERQLLEIARALGKGARLLILDEPTATLSQAEIERVFAAVRDVAAGGCAVIFISHRLDEVLGLCSRVTVMRDGKVVGDHSTAELDRPQLIQHLLGEAGDADVAPVAREASGRPVLEIRDLSVPGRVEGFDLTVEGGQIVGLAGQIGSGASDVLRALAGLHGSASGAVTVGKRRLKLGSPRLATAAGVAFVSDDRKQEGVFLGRDTGENLVATRLSQLGRFGALRSAEVKATAARIAETLGIDPARLGQPTGNLSGGNQQKVFIGRCLGRDDVDVLLLDEPTRGVDVGGRADIHNVVRRFAAEGRCVLFSSTELDELLDLADVIVTLFEGRIVAVARRAKTGSTRLLAEMTTGNPLTTEVAA